jgi:SOUL heme-binding protein
MGMVFGKTGSAEPAFEILAQRSTSPMSYEIRKYGERFAAETSWEASAEGKKTNEDDQPFTLLAKYIGVFGTPQNEGSTPIAMTAPVMKQEKTSTTEPTVIAMTAPVMKSTNQNKKTMMFVLPDDYKSIESIPKPTNPNVHIVEIPPAIGAVYKYTGSMDDTVAKDYAIKLGEQIRLEYQLNDTMSDEYILQNYQFWGYTPPFTLPWFRRNEIWLQLNDEQIQKVVNEQIKTDLN